MWSDLRRVASSSGIYAAGTLAQRGLAFILLPIYTRYIDPAQYGMLELLNAFASIVFLVLLLGLDSSINKSYHRDCATEEEQKQVLPTALVLSAPLLLLGSLVLALFADPIGVVLLGEGASRDLIYLSVGHGLLASVAGLFFASLRAREAARSFALLSLVQLTVAMLLNILLVVRFELGIRGVLWGNLSSYLVALPLSALAARQGFDISFRHQLVRPLLSFGVLLIPVALANWVVDLSDRYLLRWFSGLGEVAIYSVGYKIGMLIQLVIVWPFQLAWPAVSFAISNQEGHQKTYSRVLTYLVVLLVYSILGLSLLAEIVVPGLLDSRYHEADRVVALVALAYALNGVYYCVSPGVHVAGYTRHLALLPGVAAVVNLLLNLLFIPTWGMMGAAGSTVIAFACLAALTIALGQRVYPVAYESSRLAKATLLGLVLYGASRLIKPVSISTSIVWFVVFGVVAYPVVLFLIRFLEDEERRALTEGWRRVLRSMPYLGLKP